MRRIIPLLTVGLLVLVATDRIGKTLHTEQVSQGASTSVPAPAAPGAPPAPAVENRRSATVDAPGPSPVDRLARLAARQQLRRLGPGTYIDSMITTTDSVVRRWADRPSQAPLRVFIIEGGPSGYHSRMKTLVREALGRWDELDLGFSFADAPDSASADITVRWLDRFTIERAGQTDLTWDQTGQVHRAGISLALRTNTGLVLPDDAMLAVAVHEVGHAIGIPHSADANDVMFPATQVSVLSDRDRRTAQVLYRLPTGPLRDDAPSVR